MASLRCCQTVKQELGNDKPGSEKYQLCQKFISTDVAPYGQMMNVIQITLDVTTPFTCAR